MQEEKPNEKTITEDLDFSKPSFQFVPVETHAWRQQGPYVICKECNLEHAVYIGMNKYMTGINDKGLPILVSKV